MLDQALDLLKFEADDILVGCKNLGMDTCIRCAMKPVRRTSTVIGR